MYENTPSESSVRIQELTARLLNIILTRYSKKFANIAGLVTNLLARLLGSVTLFANQSTLRDDQDKINLAIKAAQNLERWFICIYLFLILSLLLIWLFLRIVTQLAGFKKYFSKCSPYIMSEYFHKANTLPIHASVKSILSNTIYNLIDLCDLHAVAMMHVVLPPGPKDIFKNSLAEHAKFFKYTGNV